MPDPATVLHAVLKAAREPALWAAVAPATLASVLVDIAFTFLGGRRLAGLLGALSARFGRGIGGTVAVGLLHPLLIGGAAFALALVSTRLAAPLRLWWASGLAIGAGFALLVLLLDRGTAPRRLAGPLLLGIVVAAGVRLSAGG